MIGGLPYGQPGSMEIATPFPCGCVCGTSLEVCSLDAERRHMHAERALREAGLAFRDGGVAFLHGDGSLKTLFCVQFEDCGGVVFDGFASKFLGHSRGNWQGPGQNE